MRRHNWLSASRYFPFTFILVTCLLLTGCGNATPAGPVITTKDTQDSHIPGNDVVVTPGTNPDEKEPGNESHIPELVEKLEGFFMAANGSEVNTAFYQNTVVFETPFMHTDYQIKHTMPDEEFEKISGLNWAKSIQENVSRPWMKIILRYTATMEGEIPDSFDMYLEDEMASLRRFLQLMLDNGITFDMCEFGDEFNVGGTEKLRFTQEQCLIYYDTGLRIIHEMMPEAIICADIIPVYAYSEEVCSPLGVYTMLQQGRTYTSVEFISRL